MALNYIQCEGFTEETCDDYSTLEIFNWRTRKDEVFCMWALLGECDKYHSLEEKAK